VSSEVARIFFSGARQQIDELKKQREPLKSARRADTPHETGAEPRSVVEELDAPEYVLGNGSRSASSGKTSARDRNRSGPN
jgi:hypothetical protein